MAVTSTTLVAITNIDHTPPEASPIRAARTVPPTPAHVTMGTFRSCPIRRLGSVDDELFKTLLGHGGEL
jgi:hypothetical protein